MLNGVSGLPNSLVSGTLLRTMGGERYALQLHKHILAGFSSCSDPWFIFTSKAHAPGPRPDCPCVHDPIAT